MGPTAVEEKVPSRNKTVTSTINVLLPRMAESPMYNGKSAILSQAPSPSILGASKAAFSKKVVRRKL
jgi:hypothetical protein